jgi:hypothetical protein
MYKSDRVGTVGLPPGDYAPEIAELAAQMERMALQIDDMWSVLIMIRTTLVNYGPKDMVSAWSKMVEEWRQNRKDQERESARKRGETRP